MSEPDKNDFDRDSLPPTPVPDNKVLHPIFGTHCQTQTYSYADKEKNISHVRCEAHMDDPVGKTWTVTKIVTQHLPSFNPYKRKTITNVHQVKAGVSFREAVNALADFEARRQEKPHEFSTVFPEAAAMGFAHFKAFAEREGYVFDAKHAARARPDAKALPAGASFFDDDIESANRNLARPADEFDNNGPASKTPNVHFLLDHFTRAAHGHDYTTSLAAARVLNILDKFMGQVEQAHGKLVEYCEKYQELGHGDLIAEAEELFVAAESSARQMKAYGVDTAKFDSFLLQCRISCYVLHAEGLYGLMNAGKGDFDANEALFKARVSEAMEAYKQIDSSEDGLRTLKNMIVQMPEPKVPDTIGHFIARYKETRKDYSQAKPDPAAKKAPRPPSP